MSELTNRIKRVRNWTALNQTDFARLVGMTMRGYQSNERGLTEPSFRVLGKYIELGINANWLITGKGEMLLENTPAETLENKPPEANPLEAQVNDNKEKINTLWECARDMNAAIDCLRKMHERTRQPLIKRVWDWVFGNNIKA